MRVKYALAHITVIDGEDVPTVLVQRRTPLQSNGYKGLGLLESFTVPSPPLSFLIYRRTRRHWLITLLQGIKLVWWVMSRGQMAVG